VVIQILLSFIYLIQALGVPLGVLMMGTAALRAADYYYSGKDIKKTSRLKAALKAFVHPNGSL
jgi:hypothetical protein